MPENLDGFNVAAIDLQQTTGSGALNPAGYDSPIRNGGRRRTARSSQKLESWIDSGRSDLRIGDPPLARLARFQRTSVLNTKGGANTKGGGHDKNGKSGQAGLLPTNFRFQRVVTEAKAAPKTFKNPCCQICPAQFAANLELMEVSQQRKELIYSRFHTWHKQQYTPPHKQHHTSPKPPTPQDEMTSFMELDSHGSVTRALGAAPGQGFDSGSAFDPIARFSTARTDLPLKFAMMLDDEKAALKGGSGSGGGGKDGGKAPSSSKPEAEKKFTVPPVYVPLMPGQEPCCALCPGGFDEVLRLMGSGAKTGIMLELEEEGSIATAVPARRPRLARAATLMTETEQSRDSAWPKKLPKRRRYSDADADALDPEGNSLGNPVSLLEEVAGYPGQDLRFVGSMGSMGADTAGGGATDYCCKICASQFYAPREFFDYENINSGEPNVFFLETRSKLQSSQADAAAAAQRSRAAADAKSRSRTQKGGADGGAGGSQQCCVACQKNMFSGVDTNNKMEPSNMGDAKAGR